MGRDSTYNQNNDTDWDVEFERAGLEELQKSIMMVPYLENYINLDPSLLFNHNFVNTSCSWLNSRSISEKLFAQYLHSLIIDISFALESINKFPNMLIHFDLTHTVHYNDLCRLVVKNNWRLCQSRYVSNICTIRQQLCKKALTDAYVSVLATKKRRISNKIYLKVIFRRLQN